MASPTQKKLEQTVLDILKQADMEEMTEFKIRTMASERLGIDLSDVNQKKFIRGVIESFLLSSVNDDDENNQGETSHQKCNIKKEADFEEERIICQLSKKRNVTVQNFKGTTTVSIRDYYLKDGKQYPSAKGINLSSDQWTIIRKSLPSIEEAIKKIESKIKCRSEEKVGEKGVPMDSLKVGEKGAAMDLAKVGENGAATDSVKAQEKGAAMDSVKVGEKGVSTDSVKAREKEAAINSVKVGEKGVAMDSVTLSTDLVFTQPTEPDRFNGKNYIHWALQMETFLKHLKVDYVLIEPYPGVTLSQQASTEEIFRVKVAEEKWKHDDHTCRRNILNYLSDNLYYQFSKDSQTAKALWEELRLVYLHEEFGTERSLVKKYIEFQMLEGKPISEQLLEFNNIADSIIAAGIMIVEKFHVSAIISKLPPSWRNFCLKLIHEEPLTFAMLMDLIYAEEEHRRPNNKQGDPPSNSRHCHLTNGCGSVTRQIKKPNANRRDPGTDGKTIICHNCGKKGHIAKHCHTRKFHKEKD